MAGPIWHVESIPVYANDEDLPTTQQEHGDLAVTVDPARLWIWFDVGGWTAVTSSTTVELAARVSKLEARIACLAECLSDP